MSFCEHCEGQRFDRARVLRALRQVRKDVQRGTCRSAEEAVQRALEAIKQLEIPHLEWEDTGGEMIH